MYEITKAEMSIILNIIKSPEIDYNGNNIAKVVGITPTGALKILKRLEKELVLKSKKIGKAVIYKINTEDSYARNHVALILAREKLYVQPRVKVWINELKKIKNAGIIILFGSILRKEDPKDIDVVFVTDKKRFKRLQEEVEERNKINIKRIHPLYQGFEDIVINIRKRDKPLLSAIKGIIVTGEEKFMEVYDGSCKE